MVSTGWKCTECSTVSVGGSPQITIGNQDAGECKHVWIHEWHDDKECTGFKCSNCGNVKPGDCVGKHKKKVILWRPIWKDLSQQNNYRFGEWDTCNDKEFMKYPIREGDYKRTWKIVGWESKEVEVDE